MTTTAITQLTAYQALWGGDESDPEIIVAPTIEEAAVKLAAIIEAVGIEDVTVTAAETGVFLTSPDYNSERWDDIIVDHIPLEVITLRIEALPLDPDRALLFENGSTSKAKRIAWAGEDFDGTVAELVETYGSEPLAEVSCELFDRWTEAAAA